MSENESSEQDGEKSVASRSPLLTGGLSEYMVVRAGTGAYEHENPANGPAECGERRMVE